VGASVIVKSSKNLTTVTDGVFENGSSQQILTEHSMARTANTIYGQPTTKDYAHYYHSDMGARAIAPEEPMLLELSGVWRRNVSMLHQLYRQQNSLYRSHGDVENCPSFQSLLLKCKTIANN